MSESEEKKETKKLESLTAEQEALIPVVREEWLKRFYENKGINQEDARKGIAWLYEFNKLELPKVLFADSPEHAQNIIAIFGKNEAKLVKKTEAEIEAFISSQPLPTERTYEAPCLYANVSDFGWVAFYDFFERIGVFKDYDWKNFDDYKFLLTSGIFELYTFDSVCIATSIPKVKQNAENRLHCEDGPAVRFKDGFEMYFWNGINVPENWIKNPKSIAKKDFMSEENAEKRRCLAEIIGPERLIEILDTIVIDEDTDDQGYPMQLMRTKEVDSVINEHLYFVGVTCNSTKRKYIICIPECSNVWEAKAWSFRNEKIQIRHGDVGLVNMAQEFEKPESES